VFACRATLFEALSEGARTTDGDETWTAGRGKQPCSEQQDRGTRSGLPARVPPVRRRFGRRGACVGRMVAGDDPCGRSLVGVPRNVVGDGQLVVPVGDRGDLETSGPDATFGCEPGLGDRPCGPRLCQADLVPDERVDRLIACPDRRGRPVGLGQTKSRKTMEMVVVDRARDELDAALIERLDEGVECEKPSLGGETHGWLGHRTLRVEQLDAVCAGRGRVPVVALDMLAVAPGWPAPLITSEPDSIGAPVDMIPTVPCVDDARGHRNKQSGIGAMRSPRVGPVGFGGQRAAGEDQ